MSKKKVTSVNIDDVIKRARQACSLSSDKEFADTLGLSKENFSNRKRRGTLLPIIIEWAVNEEVNLQWLVVGSEYSLGQENLDPDPVVASLMQGAQRVLCSGNPVAFDALERNIRYFDHAISAEKRADAAEKEILEMKNALAEIQEELAELRFERVRRKEEGEEQSPAEKAA